MAMRTSGPGGAEGQLLPAWQAGLGPRPQPAHHRQRLVVHPEPAVGPEPLVELVLESGRLGARARRPGTGGAPGAMRRSAQCRMSVESAITSPSPVTNTGTDRPPPRGGRPRHGRVGGGAARRGHPGPLKRPARLLAEVADRDRDQAGGHRGVGRRRGQRRIEPVMVGRRAPRKKIPARPGGVEGVVGVVLERGVGDRHRAGPVVGDEEDRAAALVGVVADEGAAAHRQRHRCRRRCRSRRRCRRPASPAAPGSRPRPMARLSVKRLLSTVQDTPMLLSAAPLEQTFAGETAADDVHRTAADTATAPGRRRRPGRARSGRSGCPRTSR